MSVTPQQIFKARTELNQRKAERDERARDIMKDNKFSLDTVPALEQLREERVRLIGQVRHHKDEQDAVALDIEGHEGSDEMYQLAARVQRLEHFCSKAEAYVEADLAKEVEEVIAQDQRQSEEEIAAYIQELQGKREQTLKRISAVQERSAKTAVRQKEAHEDPVDAEQQKSIQHAVSNVEEGNTLAEKLKKFRALKTKLQGDLVRQKREATQTEEHLTAHIKNAELTNARNARLCRELNTRNAALTTNVQLLLSQLNVEHYGIDNAPSAKQIAEERKAREATPEDSPARSHEGSFRRQGSSGSQESRSYAQSQGSRSRAKPPLVALKPTASQKSRDEANRSEREESVQARQRERAGSVTSDARSGQSSRRQSLSRPPLVASKPTAAQKSRDDAIRNEREESVQRQQQRPRGASVSSDGRPPSVAGRSTASQRSHQDSVKNN